MAGRKELLVLGVTSVTAARPPRDFDTAAAPDARLPGEPMLRPDRVSLSAEARRQLGRGERGRPGALSEAEQREVQELRRRDAHVRAHEAAHQAAGGDLTGPASFSYRLGPDGRSYAVGGEVPLQARAGRTPDETIRLARRVRAAALAPADPSPADLAAAAAAAQVEAQAAQQKRQLGQPAPGAVSRPGWTGPRGPAPSPPP